MTDKLTPLLDPRPPYYKVGGAYWIRRLNILLRFAEEDLGLLTNGAWE